MKFICSNSRQGVLRIQFYLTRILSLFFEVLFNPSIGKNRVFSGFECSVVSTNIAQNDSKSRKQGLVFCSAINLGKSASTF